jgi:hypothetical protein
MSIVTVEPLTPDALPTVTVAWFSAYTNKAPNKKQISNTEANIRNFGLLINVIPLAPPKLNNIH